MKLKSIKGFRRDKIGKKYTKSLIKDGNIPCVLYDKNTNVPFYVDRKLVRDLIYTKYTYLVDLDMDNGQKQTTIIKELQFHPVTDEVIHIDFFKISQKKPIIVEIPIKLVGNSKGVIKGGVINKNITKVKVKGIVDDIPHELEVDITDLDLNQKLRISQLKEQKYEFVTPLNIVILNIFVPRKVEPKKEKEPAKATEEAKSSDNEQKE